MSTTTYTKTLHCQNQKNIVLSFNDKNKHEAILEKAFDIATFYVPYHLRDCLPHEQLRGLPKHYLIPPQQPLELFQIIANLCTHMETQNSAFFDNLPEKINLKIENAKTLFFKLGQETFCDNVINWGRVISIFTLAGTFAAYFAKKSQTNIIVKISYWVQDFIDQHLADWIYDQGGWDDLVDKLCGDKNVPKSWSRFLAYGGVVAAAGYFILSRGISR